MAGSCLQPLPAVFNLVTNNLIYIYIAISYLRTFKRLSFWSKPLGLEPKPTDPTNESVCFPPTLDF